MITVIAQIVGVVIAAAGGLAGIAALAKIGPERRKITADAFRAGVDSTQVLSSTAVSLLEPYVDQIKFLRVELATAQDKIMRLETKCDTLTAQIKTLQAGLVT